MGGYFSGGHNKKKYHVEGTRRIDIRQLQRTGFFKQAPPTTKGYATSQQSWSSRGENTGSALIKYTRGDNFIHVIYHISDDSGLNEDRKDKVGLDIIETGFGERSYFLCPHCYTRTTTILFHGARLKCRKCANLNYGSSQECSKGLQGTINKATRHIRKLQKKLEVDSSYIDNIPYEKPLNMHWKTYNKLRNELMEWQELRNNCFGALCVEFMKKRKIS